MTLSVPRRAAHKPSTRTGLLALGALGVVFGDIGTSPLYAFSQIFAGASDTAPTQVRVLGALSLVFWTLTLVVSVKYVGLVMRADNRGEGGVMVLAALANSATYRRARTAGVLMLLGVFGAALFYGDGVITPAISVLSAVEGLEVVDPGLADFVVPIALVLLVGLFVCQRFGTARIGRVFGPVMLTWFTAIAAFGIVSVLENPGVLASVSPAYAVQFIVSDPLPAFIALGAVVLCVTGAEALYADMGQFGRRSVRTAWFAVAVPALYLNYLGQGALLLRSPEAAADSFYLMVPNALLVPTVVLATLATIIASQAVISGAFSMTQQAVRLGFLPRLRILHTSSTEEGQVYVPLVNWSLMVAVIALVLMFRSSDRLASAYGIAVTGTFVITSLLLIAVARKLWRLPLAVIAPIGGVLLLIDLAFFSANLTKFADGGWFPLTVAAGLFVLLTTWRWGYRRLTEQVTQNLVPVDQFAAGLDSGVVTLPGTAVYFSADAAAPFSLTQRVRTTHTITETSVVLFVRTAGTPGVSDSERLEVSAHGHGVYSVTATFGFMEQPHLDRIWPLCRQYGLTIDPDTAMFFFQAARVDDDDAPHRIAKHLFALMHRNALDPARYYSLPPGQVVEYGRLIRL